MSSTPMRLSLSALAVGVLALTGCTASEGDAEPAESRAPSPAITEVVTFGDSWSDAGTFDGLIFGTAEGGAWPQLLAEMYGTTQGPNRIVSNTDRSDEAGGLNYAEGGAFVAPLSDTDPETPRPMTAQLAAFLDEHGSFDDGQLVTVWAGGNDILTYLGSTDPARLDRFVNGTPTPDELRQATKDIIVVAEREADLVGEILDAGAQRVVVLNMIDLGVTDNAQGIGDGGNAVASALTATFNQALAAAFPDDERAAIFDVAALVDEIAAEPAAFGFEVVDGDACSDGSYSCGPDAWVVPDADHTYAFAGFGHFTASFRELLADRVHDFAQQTWD